MKEEREKNDSLDSNFISKVEERMRNLKQVGEGVRQV